MLNVSVTRTAWICSNSCASLKSLFLSVDLLHILKGEVYTVSNQKDALLYSNKSKDLAWKHNFSVLKPKSESKCLLSLSFSYSSLFYLHSTRVNII